VKRPVALLLVASVSGLFTAACTRGLLTYFPHREHLAKLECGGPGQPQCLSCASCHQGGSTRDGADGAWVAPTAERCTGCHEDATAIWRRSVRPAVATLPAGKAIVFAHDPHLEQPSIKGQCVGCHGGAVGREGDSTLFPPMETCLGCHEHRAQFDQGTCTNCHKPKDLRGLRPVSFLSHDGAWMRRHGAEARTGAQRCETCHAQTSCDACHDATRPSSPAVRNPEALTSELVHRFDFLSRHALEAQAAPGQCVTCHARTECDACHATRGISGSVRGGQSPHPPGWGSGLGAVSNSHGRAARRDIASCATCHDQGAASNCVRCHRVGGIGGTPHPVGWRSTAPLSSPECAACHGGLP
jgi:hypothetical protein